MAKIQMYAPLTPAGSMLVHLMSSSPEDAWDKLMKDAVHMPYKTQEHFIRRGYRVVPIDITEVK